MSGYNALAKEMMKHGSSERVRLMGRRLLRGAKPSTEMENALQVAGNLMARLKASPNRPRDIFTEEFPVDEIDE